MEGKNAHSAQMGKEKKTMVRCEICGKRLTDPLSVERGIGPECYAKGLSAAVVAERLAEQVVEELPEGMIPLNEAYRWYKEQTDIPPTRLLTACGGNRQLIPPISPMFQMVRYKGKRYLPKECISQEAQDMLAAMGKRKAKRKRKTSAETKPEAKPETKPETKAKPEAKAKAKAKAKTKAEPTLSLEEAPSSIALPGKSFIDQTTGQTYIWPSKSEVARMRREELADLYERLLGVPPADAFGRKDLVDAIEHLRGK